MEKRLHEAMLAVPLAKACSSHRVRRACIRVIDGSTFAVATQLTLLLLYTKTYDSVVGVRYLSFTA